MVKSNIDHIKNILISFPFIFVLFFIGYFPLKYDLVIQTNNIIGEGLCETYVCPSASFAAFYKIQFYFGSKLKKVTLQGFHCDVKQIQLITSNVESFEIESIDSYIKGIHLAHFDANDILPDGEVLTGKEASLSSISDVLHVDVFDPDIGATISIGQPFLPGWFLIIYFIGMLFIIIMVSFLLKFIFNEFPFLQTPLLSISCIIITLLAGCFFCGSLPYVTYVNFLLNLLILVSVSLFVNAITLPYLGTLFTMAFTTFWYIANYYVIALRGKPIMPADLKAIGTATEVMGGYTFTPSWQMILGVIVVIAYAALYMKTYHDEHKKKSKSVKRRILERVITALSAVILLVIGINTQTFKSLNSFAWDVVLLKSFHEEGMITTYLKSMFNSQVKKPEGYSREVINEYLNEYRNASTQQKEGIQPTNIIMVMNEAFSDLRTVGLNDQIDVMPYIDSLQENTVEGSLYVSVFGGGTCNTEFEALTGNSLAFLGPGTYPYTENVTDEMFSLASYFKSYGFLTESFHPNDPQNWNRNVVYPFLGFDKFNNIKDFEAFGEVKTLHDLPADINDYLFIESVSDKNNEQPRFLFDVTMQNHSGYERWLDVEKADSVAQYGSNLYVDSQIYLSLIKASDDEIKQLVETYKVCEEPTMIIFFGDHQPGLPGTAIDEIYVDVDNYLDLFKSKFFIWTNYETKGEHDYKISANYLPWLILERANYSLPPFVQMLKEVHEKYPIISSQGVMDNKGNFYNGVAEVMDDPLIKKYQYIQYANLFDEIDPAWFEVPSTK